MDSALIHNGLLMQKAEDIINDFLSMECDETHQVDCYIENPDGSTFKLKTGFKLHSYERCTIFKRKENE